MPFRPGGEGGQGQLLSWVLSRLPLGNFKFRALLFAKNFEPWGLYQREYLRAQRMDPSSQLTYFASPRRERGSG